VLWAAILAAPPVWCALVPLVAVDRFDGPAALLSAALLYPVLEELSFRGWLQGWLLDRLGAWRRYGGLSLPNLLTSLAFGVAHLASQPPLWAAAAVVPSLMFGHLRERHGSVLPPMALHVYYNCGLILFVEWAQ
jgi:uncharacterized protein